MKPLHYVALFAGAVAIFGATQYQPKQDVAPRFSQAEINQCEYGIRLAVDRPDTFQRQVGWSNELERTGELAYSVENHVGMRVYHQTPCNIFQ